jgi:uncharacterized integral membrane protein
LIWLVISLIFSLLVATFAVQNAYQVVVRFFGWELETSLALLLLGAAIAGALAVGMLAGFRQLGFSLKLMDERLRANRSESDAEQSRLALGEMRRELERLQEHNRRLLARATGPGEPPPRPDGPHPAPKPASRDPAPAAPDGAKPSGEARD